MHELEKILEEIEQNQVMLKPFDEEDRPTGIINVAVVKEIIRNHMNDGKCGECSRMKWYQKGFENGRKNNDGWISVEECLPEGNKTVLVCLYSGAIDVAWHDGYRWKTGFSHADWLSGVIAWMPLPEPYSPERSNDAKK